MTLRKVFFSFHFNPDRWRAASIRGIGVTEGIGHITPNDWEEVIGNEELTRAWIDGQIAESSCVAVLIGTETSTRAWVDYEIRRAWQMSRGLLGIHVHRLEDNLGRQAAKGRNPFLGIVLDGIDLSSVVRVYDPPYQSSHDVYRYISGNFETWIEEAIRIRGAVNYRVTSRFSAVNLVRPK